MSLHTSKEDPALAKALRPITERPCPESNLKAQELWKRNEALQSEYDEPPTAESMFESRTTLAAMESWESFVVPWEENSAVYLWNESEQFGYEISQASDDLMDFITVLSASDTVSRISEDLTPSETPGPMDSITEILEAYGYSDPTELDINELITISLPNFDDLNVERVSDTHLSVSHTYIQNHDVMSDPEIVFDIAGDEWVPIEFVSHARNVSKYDEDGLDISDFIEMWDKNINRQGFVDKAKQQSSSETEE